MQQTRITEVISFIGISALWGQHPVFLISHSLRHSRAPQPSLPGGGSICWIIGFVFPFASPSFTFEGQNWLRAVTSLFTDVAEDIPSPIVAVSGGSSSLQCVASHHGRFSWRTQALGTQMSVVWYTGFVAPWHMESSWNRDQTRVPCTGRKILNDQITREVPHLFFTSVHLEVEGPTLHSTQKEAFLAQTPL